MAQGALPHTVTVVNTSDDPDTAQQVALADLVTATSAVYSTQDKTLTVQAESSDKLLENGAPVAKLVAARLPRRGVRERHRRRAPTCWKSAPASIKVASTQGDVGGRSVAPNGLGSPALSAVASGPATAEQGAEVTLSALSSLGQITSYVWTAPANVELRGANTAIPRSRFRRSSRRARRRNLEFSLTVMTGGARDDEGERRVVAVSMPFAHHARRTGSRRATR